MGLVHVPVEVSKTGRRWETVSLLVDSGAMYSLLPRPVWQRLGLRPGRVMEFALADATVVEREVSDCRFRYGGVDAPSPVILGEENDAGLFGVVTLENLGLVLNPFDRTLRPAHARL